jgi:hypothetical protein
MICSVTHLLFLIFVVGGFWGAVPGFCFIYFGGLPFLFQKEFIS